MVDLLNVSARVAILRNVQVATLDKILYHKMEVTPWALLVISIHASFVLTPTCLSLQFPTVGKFAPGSI